MNTLLFRGLLASRCRLQPIQVQTRFNSSKSGSRWRWLPIPAAVVGGLTVVAVIQWRRIDRRRNGGVARPWEVWFYRALPLRILSRVLGHVSTVQLPVSLRSPIYRSYATLFSADLSEAGAPLDSYTCLCDFFTRSLRPGIRPVSEQRMVSPADGTVLNVGRINSCQIDQVKGTTYSIKEFLGDELKDISKSTAVVKASGKNQVVSFCEDKEWEEYKRRLMSDPDRNELYQCVVYLAPGDYHRFHSPVDWSIASRRHVQGELLSVSPRIAAWVPDLLALNERAVYLGSWTYGFFSMTAVGATNVGSIRVYDDKTLATNGRKWRDGSREKEIALSCQWEKGQEIGEFRMGSTIVLIWEAPKHFDIHLQPGDKVKVGQGILAREVSSRSQGM